MRFLFLGILFISILQSFSQNFRPVPERLHSAYQFNFKKNFFTTEAGYQEAFSNLTDRLSQIEATLNGSLISSTQWVKIINAYNAIEYDYRFIDLYLFLRYATNMKDEKADRDGDSLRSIIRKTRSLLKQNICSLPDSTVQNIHGKASFLDYFIQSVQREKAHILTPIQEAFLQPFRFLTDASFYGRAVSEIVFEKIKTKDGDIDVRGGMSSWQNSADEQVQTEGRKKLFKGYESKRDVIGFNYIRFIRGLNAFSKAKGFAGVIDEKLSAWQLPEATVQTMFSKITEACATKQGLDKATNDDESVPVRYDITEASHYIIGALGELGPEYRREAVALLDPMQGRMDLAGGENRFPLRGTASVFPIIPSVFFAFNYEGYLIDMTLLAHEAGHAIQASLMTQHKVPLLYASGPGYFTESFGKFNELLLFDYLSTRAKEPRKKALYKAQVKERLQVLFGSTEEAFIEYALINGIAAGKINTPADLDSVTTTAGSRIFPNLYATAPERKALWLLLETNYGDPFHNVNDMIGAALAIAYYKMYKENRTQFVPAYLKLLKEGYNDTPAMLLKKVNIDIESPKFIEEVLLFLATYQ